MGISGDFMVINIDKNTVALRCPTAFGQLQSPCAELRVPRELFPGDSSVFSKTNAMTASALSLSAADEATLAENLRTLGYGELLSVGNSGERGGIGMYLASRTHDRVIDVIAVLKSTEGSEWFSNFDIGYTAEHSGFSKAADFAEQKTGDYIFTRAIGTRPRFFITGYSRGGAVANILSKRLCDRYGTDGVRCYTLASPAVTISRRQARYNCIFNLIRGEDLFTRLPPESWGYSRYGRDISLSDTGDISERYRELCGDDYIGFTRRGCVDSFLCAVTRLAPNVRAYYKRKRDIGGVKLSMYEFMTSVAGMLSGEADDNAADILAGALVSEYADIVSFLSSGADLYELASSACGIPRCSVADSHSPAAYMAALERFLG